MVWTPQRLIDERMTVRVYCHNAKCHHHAAIDLTLLRDKLGPDAPAMKDDLLRRLKCGRCGSKDVGLIYSPATLREGWPENPNGNAYGKAKGR
ncbi:hypothetical protein [Nitratireductor arenosus]|uniref:hypothetical protein n=1 Tax=Nitratireductor arenosus TaxID=2682096 RepID=UPI0018D22701|nr:hypothetical protein [Nitratireductor arenosus]